MFLFDSTSVRSPVPSNFVCKRRRHMKALAKEKLDTTFTSTVPERFNLCFQARKKRVLMQDSSSASSESDGADAGLLIKNMAQRNEFSQRWKSSKFYLEQASIAKAPL